MLTLDSVYQASFALKAVARMTDLIRAPKMFPDDEVFLKTENLQNTGSFKLRGAYYKIARLTDEQKAKGVIACSAGNHAQGVALAAARQGIDALICIPEGAPISKVEATRAYGAKVELVKGVYDDAYNRALEIMEETGRTMIHPFNDEDVIAGQGTANSQHGVDAWWCDSCEPVTPEWGRQMKPEPGEMYHEFVEAAGSILPMDQINAYAMYHARAVWEGQRASMEKYSMEKGSAAKAGGPEKRVVNLTRSGWAGSQRYGTILWSGDIGASWETLKKQIPAGLQFVAAGLPYWTLDIGGFFIKGGTPWFWDGRYDETNQDPAYRELYVRWFQYGAFLPVFRSHGTDCPREPWQFGSEGDPFYDAITSAIRLRYRLLPYLYSLAGGVWLEDQTMMRPLYFDFPEDERACGISDEFLLGPALLICPVTDPIPAQNGRQTGEAAAEGTVLRRVYLPAGTDWYDLYTKKRYEGGREVETVCDISRIPVYVRAGSILPLAAEPGESAAQMDGVDVVLQVYPGADGSFTLYEDAGDGYGYEKGEYCLTRITWQEDAGRLSWETEGDGRFRKGKLEGRIIGGMQ